MNCCDYNPEHEKKYFIFFKLRDDEEMFTKFFCSKDDGEFFLNKNICAIKYYEFFESGELLDCQYYYDGKFRGKCGKSKKKEEKCI